MKKDDWIKEYSDRIVCTWHKWQSPIFNEKRYKNLLKRQLEAFFDNPSKRSLIEITYQAKLKDQYN